MQLFRAGLHFGCTESKLHNRWATSERGVNVSHRNLVQQVFSTFKVFAADSWSEFTPSACFDEISQVLMILTNQRPFFGKANRLAECTMSKEIRASSRAWRTIWRSWCLLERFVGTARQEIPARLFFYLQFDETQATFGRTRS